jgi:hypothetical protein
MTFKPVSIGALLTTTDSDIYVVPPSFIADVETITMSNNAGSNQHCTIKWYDALTATTYVLVDNHQMVGHELEQLDKPLLLKAGDKIIASSANTSVIRVSIRVKEMFTQIKSA